MSAALIVRRAGPHSSLQDRGRAGRQRYGVSVAGAFDPLRLAVANMLVGNRFDEAAIEFTLLGDVYDVAAESCRFALAGDFALTIDGTPAPCWQSHRVGQGQTIAIGAAKRGVRGYLAVDGGFAVAAVLGSRATHRRNRLGGFAGRTLAADDRLPLVLNTCPDRIEQALDPALLPPRPARLRVVPGPQDDYFTAKGLETFLSATYRIGRDSDRMGSRCEGPAIEHARGFNIVSDGIALGAIQVPGTGQPIVLGPDRQTTGGYPKIACVIAPDLGVLAQARPGDPVGFEAVSVAEATALHRAWHAAITALPGRLQPVGAGALRSDRLLGLNLISGAIDCLAPEWRLREERA